ncbi:30S ribosomal protein S14 [Candidatus Peribacteria bacterium RIFCSPHIGHO2_01_FULL_51_9]|nr:MAG: 30S ribosomal protein S14 [Candidatus Peribacteria bacterium RIFCSPHIGHO2_01_FULL_51_9]
MARLALINKQRNHLTQYLHAKAQGKKSKFPTRVYNRCGLCGRRHGFMRFFGICRICFRELAVEGDIPGITKSSW